MAEGILTTITPPSASALVLLDVVKADLGLAGTFDQDPWLASEIIAASATIARHCDRVWGRATVQETFRAVGHDREALLLSRCPVVAVASVLVDGTALAPEGFEVDAEAGILYRLDGDERRGWRARAVVVTYTAGYLLPGQAGRDLPADVERAARLLVTAAYEARGRDPMLRSESVQGVGAVSYLDPRAGAEDMPPQAAALLSPYRMLRA
ncbi:MAG TPA: hypothetical protein VGN96_04010 [Roseococcus sp.]|nr:hypothetical protein [Roseococcus sp.]